MRAAAQRERGGAYEAIAVTAAPHAIDDDAAERLRGRRRRHEGIQCRAAHAEADEQLMRGAQTKAQLGVVPGGEVHDASLSQLPETGDRGVGRGGLPVAQRTHCGDGLGGRSGTPRVRDDESEGRRHRQGPEGSLLEVDRGVGHHRARIDPAGRAVGDPLGHLDELVLLRGLEHDPRGIGDRAHDRGGAHGAGSEPSPDRHLRLDGQLEPLRAEADMRGGGPPGGPCRGEMCGGVGHGPRVEGAAEAGPARRSQDRRRREGADRHRDRGGAVDHRVLSHQDRLRVCEPRAEGGRGRSRGAGMRGHGSSRTCLLGRLAHGR